MPGCGLTCTGSQTRLETQNGDGEAWAALARVLEKAALMEEACLPDASAETDEDGTAVLDALCPGLYLLSGQSVCVNRQIYTPSPMLIVCPTELRGRAGADPQSGKGGLFRPDRLGR